MPPNIKLMFKIKQTILILLLFVCVFIHSILQTHIYKGYRGNLIFDEVWFVNKFPGIEHRMFLILSNIVVSQATFLFYVLLIYILVII